MICRVFKVFFIYPGELSPQPANTLKHPHTITFAFLLSLLKWILFSPSPYCGSTRAGCPSELLHSGCFHVSICGHRFRRHPFRPANSGAKTLHGTCPQVTISTNPNADSVHLTEGVTCNHEITKAGYTRWNILNSYAPGPLAAGGAWVGPQAVNLDVVLPPGATGGQR